MIEVVTFSCPSCAKTQMASASAGNSQMLCSNCGNAVSVPRVIEEAATNDHEHPKAPVIFVKPTTSYHQSRFFPSLMKVVLASVCLGAGIALVWYALSNGLPTWGEQREISSTGLNKPKPSGTASEPAPANQNPTASAMHVQTQRPAELAAPIAASTVQHQESTPIIPVATVDPEVAEIARLKKEREHLLLKIERERLEQEVAQLKGSLPSQSIAVDPPSGEELRAQLRQANGDLAIAQQSLNTAIDERAVLRNYLGINVKKLAEKTVSAEQSKNLIESSRHYQARLSELSQSIPTLEKNVKSAGENLQTLKDLAKAEAATKPESSGPTP